MLLHSEPAAPPTGAFPLRSVADSLWSMQQAVKHHPMSHQLLEIDRVPISQIRKYKLLPYQHLQSKGRQAWRIGRRHPPAERSTALHKQQSSSQNLCGKHIQYPALLIPQSASFSPAHPKVIWCSTKILHPKKSTVPGALRDKIDERTSHIGPLPPLHGNNSEQVQKTRSHLHR